MMTIHAVPMITPKTVRMVRRILRRHRLDAASATISKNVIVVHILLKPLRGFFFLFEHDYDYHGSACCNQNPSPPWETGLRRNIFSGSMPPL